MIWPTDILSTETWVLIGTILGLAWYYVHRKWQVLKKLNIPHESPSLSQFGHMKKMFGKEAFVYDNECKAKFGPIYGSYFGLAPSISIHNPDMLRQIFIKEFPNFPSRQSKFVKVNGKEMNTGLNIVVGDQWKRIRSAMSPTFSTSKLKEMTGIIAWCADNTVKVFERKIKDGDGSFDVKEVFSRLSLDIVCSAAFSTNVESQDDTREEPEIAKRAKDLFSGSLFSFKTLMIVLVPGFEDLMAKLDLSLFSRKALVYFRSLTDHVIKRRHEDPHAQNRVDFMQLLLDAEVPEESLRKGVTKGLTRNEIVGNSMLMILAGYENTANTLGFLAYCLATNPEIQKDVQKEIDEMFESRGKFDYEGVNNLKMLEMCFNETLRLYNPILRNARVCKNETTINGLTIPAGMLVSVPSYALSHDPEYWEDPEEFKPERMRDMTQIDPMVFQPFGAGPRNCIGMRFAIMEVKMSIAKLLHKFSFQPTDSTPPPPLELKFGLSVRPAVDLKLKVVHREDSKK